MPLRLAAIMMFCPSFAWAGPPKTVNGVWGIDPVIADAATIEAFGCETAPTRMTLANDGTRLEMVQGDREVRGAEIIDYGINTLHYVVADGSEARTIVFLDDDHFITFPYRGDRTPNASPDMDGSDQPRRVVTERFSVAAMPWQRCEPGIS